MSSSLAFSDFNKKDNTENKYQGKKHKKTYKKRDDLTVKKKVTGENVENFLNLMTEVGNDGDDDGSGLADFKPPPKPVLSKQPDPAHNNIMDDDVDASEFEKLDNFTSNEQYFKQYVPYYSNSQNNTNVGGNKDVLFEKLNYVIQMLEDNKDQQTHNVTEELVLYMFLGVFVIFVVDSFARSGKYIR